MGSAKRAIPSERHADAVADRVVQGKSAEDLLDRFAGQRDGPRAIQRRALQFTGQTTAPTTAPASPQAPAAETRGTETTSSGATPGAPFADGPMTVAELVRLDPARIRAHLESRPSAEVDTIRNDPAFRRHIESLPDEDLRNIALAIIVRCPNTLIDRAGARAEAVRILSTQLRDRTIILNLLRNQVRVVVVPRNMLMTDLPEFAAQRNTFTMDGRPWDVTRGMGGRTTAVTEENLLGLDQVSGVEGRRGWESRQAMENARRGDRNAMPQEGGAGVRVFNAGVYCSGYSTTNHEFFHTIHQYGLTRADSQLIDSEYRQKRTHVRTMDSGVDVESETEPTLYDVPWADGIRRNLRGDPCDNYASSTVYEYFAQTGCAFQGTNAGNDDYTGRPRNNGRGWVQQHEPRLAGLLARVCSDETLRDINPRDARRAASQAPAPTSGTSGTSAPAPAGGTSAPAPTSGTSAPAPAGGTSAPAPAPTTNRTIGEVAPPSARVGDNAVGGIVQR